MEQALVLVPIFGIRITGLFLFVSVFDTNKFRKPVQALNVHPIH